MRRGFTLVELSIVLVIIGLLIGGILVAQSMVQTAKINKFVQTIQQFDVAAVNFKTKFKSIPGDSSAMGCGYQWGGGWPYCDDGYLEDGTANPRPGSMYTNNLWGGERGDYWPQLQLSGFVYNNGATFVNSPITSDSIMHSGSTLNAPGAEMINDKIAILPTGMGGLAELRDGATYYQICEYVHDVPGSGNTFCATNNIGGGIPPAFAKAVDLKIDDGKSRTGEMVSYDTGNQSCLTAGTLPGDTYAATTEYFPGAANASNGCITYIRVAGSSGKLE